MTAAALRQSVSGNRLAMHFVSAEIQRFPAGNVDAAKEWILGGS